MEETKIGYDFLELMSSWRHQRPNEERPHNGISYVVSTVGAGRRGQARKHTHMDFQLGEMSRGET